MIWLSGDRSAIIDGASIEPVYGSIIETLFDAYSSFPGLCDYYILNGGVMSRQGAELTLSGWQCDISEIIEFAKMAGADKIQCMTSAVGGEIPQGVKFKIRQSMYYPHGACTDPEFDVDGEPNINRVFDLVRLGSAPSYDHAERAAFITDIGRRRRLGLAKVFTAADASTAGVYATGATHALIACVATLPQSRGNGYATSAVRAAVRHCIANGRTAALVADSGKVVDFYINLGFLPGEESVTFTLD